MGPNRRPGDQQPMKELHKKALLYSTTGVLAVIATAFTTNLLAPQNALGEGLRFSVPVLTGIIGGAIIFFRLREIRKTDKQFNF